MQDIIQKTNELFFNQHFHYVTLSIPLFGVSGVAVALFAMKRSINFIYFKDKLKNKFPKLKVVIIIHQYEKADSVAEKVRKGGWVGWFGRDNE